MGILRGKVKKAYSGLTPNQRRGVKLTVGAFAGGLLGFGYYALVGCTTGGCPITSNPMISTAWGAVIGGLATTG